jgi:hypothetical protein
MHWLSTLFQVLGKPFQWWVVVAPWEQGLRVRLGRTSAFLAPGIHLRVPFLDRVYVQSVRLRTLIETNQTATTKDRRTVTFSLATDFCITDIRQLFEAFSSPEITIGAKALAAAAAYIAEHDREAITPAAIAQAATDHVSFANCGIGRVCSSVTAFSEGRTLRLIHSEYRTGAGLYSLDGENSGLR